MMSAGEGPAGRKKLPAARRRAVSVSAEELVRAEPLRPGGGLPLVLRPAVAEVDAAGWAAENRELLARLLAEHGALLFRGFGARAAEEFGRFCRAASGDLLAYRERSSPRSQVAENIYSSTDYPPDRSIFLHCEHSYSLTFPLRLYFFCETPAASGGETPLADTRGVYRRIDPRVRERFAERGWMYVRNFGDGLGLPWQTSFQTSDRAEVERYCRAADISVEWKDGDRLRTRQVREAVVRHPRTGEPVWFNHITFFHVTTLEDSIRETLLAGVEEADLPNNSYYGDGSPIEPEVVEHLRQAYRDETVSFPWERGDILVLDNMLSAHGRSPYAGPRKILVAMAEPFTRRAA